MTAGRKKTRFPRQRVPVIKYTDEMCTCGHLRSEHGNRRAIGHGACMKIGCSCAQFTWKAFV